MLFIPVDLFGDSIAKLTCRIIAGATTNRSKPDRFETLTKFPCYTHLWPSSISQPHLAGNCFSSKASFFATLEIFLSTSVNKLFLLLLPKNVDNFRHLTLRCPKLSAVVVFQAVIDSEGNAALNAQFIKLQQFIYLTAAHGHANAQVTKHS